jgi:hypothetical protein
LAFAHHHRWPHALGIVSVFVVAVLLIGLVLLIGAPSARRRVLRATALVAGTGLGLFLVARGIAEFFILTYSDPASYARSWGGPSLAGVIAVHSGPGLLVVIGVGWWLARRVRSNPSNRG